MIKNNIRKAIMKAVESDHNANELSGIISEINENYPLISELVKNENITAEILSAVNSEAYTSPPAVYAQPVTVSPSYDRQDIPSYSGSEINRLIEELNKPIQIVLDKDVLGTAMMNFNNQYKRTTRT